MSGSNAFISKKGGKEAVCFRDTGLCVPTASVHSLAKRKEDGDWDDAKFNHASSEERAARKDLNTAVHASDATRYAKSGPGRPPKLADK
jgi:hypothetical protein